MRRESREFPLILWPEEEKTHICGCCRPVVRSSVYLPVYLHMSLCSHSPQARASQSQSMEWLNSKPEKVNFEPWHECFLCHKIFFFMYLCIYLLILCSLQNCIVFSSSSIITDSCILKKCLWDGSIWYTKVFLPLPLPLSFHLASNLYIVMI